MRRRLMSFSRLGRSNRRVEPDVDIIQRNSNSRVQQPTLIYVTSYDLSCDLMDVAMHIDFHVLIATLPSPPPPPPLPSPTPTCSSLVPPNSSCRNKASTSVGRYIFASGCLVVGCKVMVANSTERPSASVKVIIGRAGVQASKTPRK